MQVQISANPVPKKILDYCRSVAKTEKEFEREKQAYLEFCARYERERNRRNRIVMQNTLNYLFSDEHDMRPSYVLASALDYALSQERKAARRMYPVPLHEGIREILTTSTDTVGLGQTTRWKLRTRRTEYSEFTGDDRKPFDGWTAGEILRSYVSFGSHNFSIGGATQRILSLLEERYGLDFKALEKRRKTKK